MTVQDLITKLSAADPTCDVKVWNSRGELEISIVDIDQVGSVVEVVI